MRLRTLFGVLISSIFGAAFSASASIITYDVISNNGGDYEVEFTVVNDTLSSAIEEFSIYMPVFDVSNVAISASPTNWDGLAIEPDMLLPDDGFVDWLALSAPINPGQALSGFFATFTLAVNVQLGDFFFEIIDPTTFAVLDSGMATLNSTTPPSQVPLPGAALFMLSGLAGLRLIRSRRRS